MLVFGFTVRGKKHEFLKTWIRHAGVDWYLPDLACYLKTPTGSFADPLKRFCETVCASMIWYSFESVINPFFLLHEGYNRPKESHRRFLYCNMRQLSGWAVLPDFLLEEVFCRLELKYLARCAQVCSNWHRVTQSNYVWHEFHFKDYIFTRRRFTLHAGWQMHIDHPRVRWLIMWATPKWRKLVIEPISILFNLYEFFRLLANTPKVCVGIHEGDRPLKHIHSFSFEWRLHIHENDRDLEKEIGTGGEMLRSLSDLLSQLDGLTELSLRELQLEYWEGSSFLDQILCKFESQMRYLCVVNFTAGAHPFLQFGLFLQLRKLVISAQHLDEDLVILIADLKLLGTFIIYQDEKTLGAKAVNVKAWLVFKENNSHTKIYLQQSGKPNGDLIIQPQAPVYAIIYDDSLGRLTRDLAQQICINYASTLQYFIQKKLERRFRSKKFCDRADIPAVEVLSECSQLKLFALRERVAYGTAVLLALVARSQNTILCLRRNAILRRMCWSQCLVKSLLARDIDYDWVRAQCRNYKDFKKVLCDITNSAATVVSDNRYMYSFENRF